MPRVLSKLAIAVALALAPPLAVCGSAQSTDYAMALRRQGYVQPVEEEVIEPGVMEEPADGPEAYYDEDDGPLVGEFGEQFDDNSCLFPGAGPYEENESLFPDGTFKNCGPMWYSNVAFTMMQRSAPTHQGTALPVAQNLEEIFSSTTSIITRPLVMGTSGVDFHFTPGMRATLGRNLFEDILHRQHSVEFTFIGLNTWSTSGVAIGSGQITGPNFIRAANLFSLFPFAVGGFNNATMMTMADSSSFSNWELNYRIAKLPRPDRITQLPDGTWMQVATPTLVPSFLFGFRMFNLNDHFNWFSTGTNTNGTTFTGVYNVKTTNLLAGAQIGGDLVMNQNIWQLGMRAKAGVYGNLARQWSDVEINDPVAGNSSGSGQGQVPTTAFIGDLGFFGTTRLTERIHFRAGYDLIWVGGIANAAEQLQYTTNIAPVVRKNGHMLLQGVNLGFDICW
ncbi:MAG TPA: BBP7 family outer membrane beta-barrel protein [Pirellulales bacterium]|nr:BBP7 family outer membrane beta-barrel protein [Pirellulales bacterium]